MINLLCAQKKPPFGWYYLWLKLSDIGIPQQDISTGTRQLDTIKFFSDQPNSAMSGGTQALSISIVPSKGIWGRIQPHLHNQGIQEKIMVCLNDTATDHPKRLHDLFSQYLQGAAANIWTAVLNTVPVASQMAITLKAATKAYCEKIAAVANI
eukprot:1100767-Ditylum_brightwellii.AAC.1